MSSSLEPTPKARRRNPATHQAILDATVRLLERDGYGSLTIEGVAAEAGVGKQTIYRWWRGKAELVVEAYIAESDALVPAPDTGNVTDDLEAILVSVFAMVADYRSGVAMANKGLMAEAQLDPAFQATYLSLHRAWWEPHLTVLERAQARGEIRPDVDPGDLIDIMLGATWYRVLLEHAPLDETFARLIVRSLVESNRPQG
jgi:AcrR family transcriptional regulator